MYIIRKYTILALVLGVILFLLSLVFMNDWILKHDFPYWLRTIVYLVNPPDKLRDAVEVAEIIDGIGYIKYTNEYYGYYSIYIADDIVGPKYTKLDSAISYRIVCDGDAELDASGSVEYLPQSILEYEVQNNIPVNGELICSIEVVTQEPIKLYVFVNKLFDT